MTAPTVVGVLALQGAFREHMASLRRVPNVVAVEIRTREQLWSVSGLVIPGGESTTMALVAERWGLIPDLQRFVKEGRPVWGTCAGLIFLADSIEGAKENGQALIGGLDVKVSRNFFGAQLESFEIELEAPEALRPNDALLLGAFGSEGAARTPTLGAARTRYRSAPTADSSAPASSPDKFRAMFIRAPAILEAGPGVEVLATCPVAPGTRAFEASGGRAEVIVAVRSGRLLATSFHPELTADPRWHALFVDEVRAAARADGGKWAEADARRALDDDAPASSLKGAVGAAPPAGAAPPRRAAGLYPADLPTYH